MKLKQFNFDDYKDYDYSKFGKFPKTKYTLMLRNIPSYFFVTTCRSESEAVEILTEKASEYATSGDRQYYKIISNFNGVKKILKKGKIKLNL